MADRVLHSSNSPSDLFSEEISDSFDPKPVPAVRYGPDSSAIEAAAEALLDAECPVLYAGQGVHYAQAWDSLKELAELLGAPVTTSLGGKSAFPENHPLALGSGGRAIPKPVHHFLQKTDLILGIGCSFTRTGFGVRIPEGKRVIHATLDPADINKDIPVETALVGDAGLILDGLVEAVRDRSNGTSESRAAAVSEEISAVKAEWLEQWKSKLTYNEAPLSPYRVIWDLLHTVDVENTIITHDAGSPRDQMSPFWQSVAPLTYIGWGKTTQLGYGLGLAMGAKLARPDHLCVNVWGMLLSALQVWISRLQCEKESRFCRYSSTISPWQLRSRLCLYLPKNSVVRTSPVTTLIWRKHSAVMANVLRHLIRLSLLFNAASRKRKRVYQHSLSLSLRKKLRFPVSKWL